MSSSHQRSPDRQRAGLGGAEDKDAARPKVTGKEKVKEEVEKRDLRILKRNMLKTVTQCGVDPSQSFKGSYDLLGIVLGKGTFGTVELAKCQRTGRFVAAKKVELDRGQSTIPFTEHAVREIMNLKRVAGHPKINAYCNSYLESPGLESSLLIVTEFIAGGSLDQYVRTRGRLDERQMRRVTHQLASALAHCHRRGLIHRDVKPENIVVSNPGHAGFSITLVDFGSGALVVAEDEDVSIARPMTPNKGTYFFMAKEALDLNQMSTPYVDKTKIVYSSSVDTYSAGATVLQCAVGMRPRAHTESLRRVLRRFPDATILSRMISKEPSERPTCDEVLDDPWVIGGMDDDLRRLIEENNMLERKNKELQEESRKPLRRHSL